MQKYLKYFPKPLLADLVAGRWLPVLGAGMSKNADVPAPHKMPLWPELAEKLQDDLGGDYPSSGALDAISAYQHEFGRPKLLERLSDLLLVREARPGVAHEAFCSIPFDIVCTTNFDFLIERQYEAIGRHVYPIVDEEQLAIATPSTSVQLLKLHGDLHHPGRLVVTEEDYDAFLTRHPLIATYLANQLITKTAVLVGYSLDDPDFRMIWRVVSDRLGRSRRSAYTILVGAKPGVVSRFQRRGVQVIELPGKEENYKIVLAEAFAELREHVRENVISVSSVTDEESLSQLRLPRDATTRLCFFSVPLESLPFYRSHVFPLAENAGLVPITAEDVISPGDSVNAKIDSLIDRAAVMVVEPGSPGTMAEFRTALARKRSEDARTPNKHELQLIIVSSGERQPWNVEGFFYTVVRAKALVDDQSAFLTQIGSAFENVAATLGVDQFSEARRLLRAGENSAAVISAITQLERLLRKLLVDQPRAFPLRHLVDAAIARGLMRWDDRFPSWMKLRNEAVHLGDRISTRAAKEAVEGIERMLVS